MCRKRLRSTWLIFLGLIYILGSAECYLADEYDDNVGAPHNENDLILEEQMEEMPDFENRVSINKREPAFTPYISVGALSNMQQFFENLKENLYSLENLSQEERKALLGKHEQSAGECVHHRRKQSTSAFSYPRTRKHTYRKHVTLNTSADCMGIWSNPRVPNFVPNSLCPPFASPRTSALLRPAAVPDLPLLPCPAAALHSALSHFMFEQETRIFRPPATAAYLHAVRNQRPSHKIRNFVANAEPSYLRGSNHYDPSYLWTGLGRRR